MVTFCGHVSLFFAIFRRALSEPPSSYFAIHGHRLARLDGLGVGGVFCIFFVDFCGARADPGCSR